MFVVKIRQEQAYLETDVRTGAERTFTRLRWVSVAHRASYDVAKAYAERECGDYDSKIDWEDDDQ